jgi:hypothetical protein
MIPLLEKNFRKPPMTESVLFGILAFCALVDFPSNFRMFGTSGVGAGTFAAAGLIWALFLSRPVISNHLIKAVLFLLCFNIYSGSTLLWSHTGMDGIQQLTVSISFTGIILVCAREAEADESRGHLLTTALLAASVISVLMYLYVIYSVLRAGFKLGVEAEGIINPRPYALYALAVVAVALAKWRGSSKIMPLFWALLVTVTVGLSMSRTALVCCIILFPLSIALRLNIKSAIQGAVILALGAGSFAAALFLYPPLYNRFFAEDAAIKMGNVSLNTSGRTRIWQVLWETIGNDWTFGKGIGAAVIVVRDKFHGEIAQPHNDYLRFYYDTGMVGLALWLLFAYAFTSRTVGNLWRSVRNQTSDYPLHVAALLAFFALSWSMLTDNSQVYSYVMMPLAVIFGCSLGAGEKAMLHLKELEVQYYEEPQPLPRNVRMGMMTRGVIGPEIGPK